MIIVYTPETDVKGRVEVIYHDESLYQNQKNAIQVEQIPEPENIQYKVPVMFVNPQTNEIFYEYESRGMTADEELEILKKENATFKDQLKATQDTLDFLLLG